MIQMMLWSNSQAAQTTMLWQFFQRGGYFNALWQKGTLILKPVVSVWCCIFGCPPAWIKRMLVIVNPSRSWSWEVCHFFIYFSCIKSDWGASCTLTTSVWSEYSVECYLTKITSKNWFHSLWKKVSIRQSDYYDMQTVLQVFHNFFINVHIQYVCVQILFELLFSLSKKVWPPSSQPENNNTLTVSS